MASKTNSNKKFHLRLMKKYESYLGANKIDKFYQQYLKTNPRNNSKILHNAYRQAHKAQTRQSLSKYWELYQKYGEIFAKPTCPTMNNLPSTTSNILQIPKNIIAHRGENLKHAIMNPKATVGKFLKGGARKATQVFRRFKPRKEESDLPVNVHPKEFLKFIYRTNNHLPRNSGYLLDNFSRNNIMNVINKERNKEKILQHMRQARNRAVAMGFQTQFNKAYTNARVKLYNVNIEPSSSNHASSSNSNSN
jgi:hypothetical protein